MVNVDTSFYNWDIDTLKKFFAGLTKEDVYDIYARKCDVYNAHDWDAERSKLARLERAHNDANDRWEKAIRKGDHQLAEKIDKERHSLSRQIVDVKNTASFMHLEACIGFIAYYVDRLRQTESDFDDSMKESFPIRSWESVKKYQIKKNLGNYSKEDGGYRDDQDVYFSVK